MKFKDAMKLLRDNDYLILESTNMEDAKALQWNKDTSELFQWVKSFENDNIHLTLRKQNMRYLKLEYKTENNEYPIIEIEDIFLTPDYVRMLDADEEPLENYVDFYEYSVEFNELKYSKEYNLKQKQWKMTDLKKLTYTELQDLIKNSIKQLTIFCKKKG